MEINHSTNLKFQKKTLLEHISKQGVESREILKKALLTAERAHQGQVREEGAEYIIHPIRAALVLLQELKITDTNLLAAALLHDVVEDTDASIEDIKNNFGEEVGRLVRNLTRERPSDEAEEQKKEAKKKKLTETFNADDSTRLVKCADLLDNMRSWKSIPKENLARKKFPRWFEEAEKYYIPIAKKTNKYLASEMRKTLSCAVQL